MLSIDQYLATGTLLKWLLATAWLLPLAGFAVEIFGGVWSGRRSKGAGYLAIGCIGLGFVCSVAALVVWGNATNWSALKRDGGHHDSHAVVALDSEARAQSPEAEDSPAEPQPQANLQRAAGSDADDAEEPSDHGPADDADHDHAGHSHEHGDEHHAGAHGAGHGNDPFKTAYYGTFYTLAHFGELKIAIDYYIDGLTIVMFVMVTLIATCIHVFATGYMSDELTEQYEDHEVHLPGGRHFHRPGRFYRFFAFLSLFCFSMLGLVLAGNIFQVFVFWELVGVCSYLLIGFYTERHTASTAANKAFIMNRVGDFGFLIGLMILWTWFGTFSFADPSPQAGGGDPGLFQMVRDTAGALDVSADGETVYLQDGEGHRLERAGAPVGIPYFLLVAAGLGIFAGCIGKSAQFPLQTWLPDAMEGPTPVSALVHSATMVAAGVYLAGRFYPMFTAEVLLVIAYIGCITLFIGATIAIVATDIKRVLAYSTISQLGYMMLALGVGGWGAGLFHLITHAFFKSLLFLCSGSVIHGCHHVQEMPRMGGLFKKMPITAITMLIGVIAICGLAIPGVTILGEKIAFSGYHSKDAIVATALAYMRANSGHFLLFVLPLLTAGITAFYMFRLWFYTFLGEPRDKHVYDHAHESPAVMTGPLIVLALFAMFVAFGGETQRGILWNLLASSEPTHVAAGYASASALTINLPGHDQIHEVHTAAGTVALLVAIIGTIMAYVIYGANLVDRAALQRHFAGTHRFLTEKWQFDNLYDVMFTRPVHTVGSWCQAFDRRYLDGFLHGVARGTVDVSRWDRRFDESIIDGTVNWVGDTTYKVGRSFRHVQTGHLRQYVMFIALGVIGLVMMMFVFFPR